MEIISFIFGAVIISLNSFNFFNKLDYDYFLVSLFIFVSPIPFISFTNIWVVKYYLYISSTLVLIYSIRKLSIFTKDKFSNLKATLKDFFEIDKDFKINLFILFLSIFFCLIVTYKMNPYSWRFDTHDLLYFSWFNEISTIDYDGALRLPTAYPYLSSANHLKAGSLLIPFVFLKNNINIFQSYSVKFILIVSGLISFAYQYLKYFYIKTQKSNIKLLAIPLLFLLVLFLFYLPEIDYSLGISNFPFILLALAIGSNFIKRFSKSNNSDFQNYDKVILYFFYCLIVTKATTFPVILLSTLIFIFTIKWKNLKYYFYNKDFILLASITLMNIFSWVLPKSNHGSLGFASPLCLLDPRNKLKENIICLSGIFKNPYEGWFVDSHKLSILKNFNIPASLNSFLFLWIICLLPLLITGYILYKNSNFKFLRILGKFYICHTFSISIAVIFIRTTLLQDGGIIFNSYVIAPIFAIIGFLLFFAEKYIHHNITKLKFIFMISLFPLIIIYSQLDSSNILSRSNFKNNPYDFKNKSVTLNLFEAKQFDENLCTNNKKLLRDFKVFLDKNGCGGSDIGEIKAGLESQRTNKSLLYEDSVIKQWAITN